MYASRCTCCMQIIQRTVTRSHFESVETGLVHTELNFFAQDVAQFLDSVQFVACTWGLRHLRYFVFCSTQVPNCCGEEVVLFEKLFTFLYTFVHISFQIDEKRIITPLVMNLITANYNYHQYLSASWNFIIPRFPNTRIQNRISYQRWKPRSLRVFRGNNPSSGISVFTFVNYTSCIVSRWKAILKFPSIDIYIYITILIYVAVQASRVHLVVDRRESTPVNTDPPFILAV